MTSDVVHQIAAASMIIFGVMVFGTILYYNLEGWSLLNSVYFIVTSVFTVGYGDVIVSPQYRVMTAVFLIFACTLTLACSSVIGKGILQIIQDKAIIRKEKRITINLKRRIDKLKEEGVEITDDEITELKSELDKVSEELKGMLASDKEI
jgi:voltage-gated potassium channel